MRKSLHTLSIPQSAGFTLIELLISLGIVVFVTTLVLINLRGQGQELRLAADNLASLIRKAQVQSLAGSQINGQVPVGGYGVNLAVCDTLPCAVNFFADFDGQLDFDGGEELRETLTLPAVIKVSALTPATPLTVIFKPPQSLVCINRDCTSNQTAVITLLNLENNQTRTVRINQVSGQVSVQ